MPLTTARLPGLTIRTMSTSPSAARQPVATFSAALHRIFRWRLMNSSFKYSKPSRRLVMVRSAEMLFSTCRLAAVLAASIWFRLWADSCW